MSGNFTYFHPDTQKKETRKNNDFDSEAVLFKSQFHFNPQHQIQLVYNTLNSKMGSPGPLYFGQSLARLQNNRQLVKKFGAPKIPPVKSYVTLSRNDN